MLDVFFFTIVVSSTSATGIRSTKSISNSSEYNRLYPSKSSSDVKSIILIPLKILRHILFRSSGVRCSKTYKAKLPWIFSHFGRYNGSLICNSCFPIFFISTFLYSSVSTTTTLSYCSPIFMTFCMFLFHAA